MNTASIDLVGDPSREERQVVIPALLPTPPGLHKAGDNLCETCKGLDLSPRRFVVFPEDSDAGDNERPDDPNIRLGFVDDLRNKPHCPFCRLVLTALGAGLPSAQDGHPVLVKLS